MALKALATFHQTMNTCSASLVSRRVSGDQQKRMSDVWQWHACMLFTSRVDCELKISRKSRQCWKKSCMWCGLAAPVPGRISLSSRQPASISAYCAMLYSYADSALSVQICRKSSNQNTDLKVTDAECSVVNSRDPEIPLSCLAARGMGYIYGRHTGMGGEWLCCWQLSCFA